MLADRTDGFALQSGFTENLKRTIERFNRFARAGTDEDFSRGATWAEAYFSVEFRKDPMPNFTMYPIADTGPYYAVILGGSCLGTKGGPKINTRSQVLRPDGRPIPGLYGAGNCIGSPTGEAYWGGGSTLGPALFHGYLAGKNVVQEPARVPVAARTGGDAHARAIRARRIADHEQAGARSSGGCNGGGGSSAGEPQCACRAVARTQPADRENFWRR